MSISPTSSFIIPQFAPQPWKSEWRKDFESYLDSQPKVKTVPAKRPVRIVPSRKQCEDCRSNMHADSVHDLCWKCRRKGAPRPPKAAPPPRPTCKLCPAVLNRNNSHGLCGLHYTQHVRRLNKKEPKRCEVCQRIIRAHSRFPLCGEHGRVQRRAVEYEQKKRRREAA